ncbi:MAG: ABC transporter ATP-binding protein, partial [bacterium]
MKETLTYLWKELGNRRALFLAGIFISIPSLLLEMLWTPIPGKILDQMLERDVSKITTEILAILVLSSGANIMLFLQRRIVIGISRKMEYDMRKTFFAHLQRLTPSFYDKHSSGDISSRISNDLSYVRELVGAGSLHASRALSAIAIILVFMFAVSWKLTIISACPFLIMPFASRAMILYIQRKELEARSVTGNISTFIGENFNAVQIIKNYHAEGYRLSSFKRVCGNLRKINIKIGLMHALFHSSIEFTARLGIIILILAGGVMIMRGIFTPGLLLTMLLFLLKLIWPVIGFGWVLTLIQRGASGLTRLREILHQKPDFAESLKCPISFESGPIVDIKNLSFFYAENKTPVLRDINMRIYSGQTAAIAGPTGCGKTTLLKLIGRTYPVEHGEMLLFGTNINQISFKQLRKKLAFVPQEPFIFSQTIGFNVGYG